LLGEMPLQAGLPHANLDIAAAFGFLAFLCLTLEEFIEGFGNFFRIR